MQLTSLTPRFATLVAPCVLIVLTARCSPEQGAAGSVIEREDGDASAGGNRSAGGAAGGGGIVIVGDGGGGSSTCDRDAGCGGDGGGAPAPYCGDGLLNQPDEACDDGNAASGDGCTGSCAQIEADHACPTSGDPCVSTVACGDETITGSETCDDGNTTPNDGCDVECHVEAGWACPVAGLSCTAAECGDGILVGVEECERPATNPTSGCSAECRIEDGYDCNPATLTCSVTLCGNTAVERGEGCEDGNELPFDGCYECRNEPSCSGGVCAADAPELRRAEEHV